MAKDYLMSFWAALGSIVGVCVLLLAIIISPTTDFVKEIAVSIALTGILYLYIQLVVVRKIDDLARRRSTSGK